MQTPTSSPFDLRTPRSHSNSSRDSSYHGRSGAGVSTNKSEVYSTKPSPKPLRPNGSASASAAAPPLPPIKIADSGCTDTVFRLSDAGALTNVKPITDGLRLMFPNGTSATSVATGTYPLNSETVSLLAHIFEDEHMHHSLFALSQLANQLCVITLTATDITVVDRDGHLIMSGTKAPNATLWPLHAVSAAHGDYVPAAMHSAQLAIRNQLDAEYVNFVVATLGSPPASTLLKAIANGWLKGLTRLTQTMVRQNYPNPTATAFGHLQANRQGQRSTKSTVMTASMQTPTEPTPAAAASSGTTADDRAAACDGDSFDGLVCAVVPLSDMGAHADLAGRFPFTSRTGNQYLLVCVHGGYVHFELLVDRTSSSYVKAFTSAIAFFKSRVDPPPIWYRIDNECSKAVERLFNEARIALQKVPAGDHRTNKAERAILDGKAHIISTLCTAHKDFPITLWDECIPQVEDTLNLLRPWQRNPAISAYQGLHGHDYDFNAHPISIFGAHVVIYVARPPAGTRTSWGRHGDDGYYLGATRDSYRSYRVYDIESKGIRTSNSLSWHIEPLRLPGSSPLELIHAAITDVATAIHALADSPHIPPAGRQPFSDSTTSATASLHALMDQYLGPAATPDNVALPSHYIATPAPRGAVQSSALPAALAQPAAPPPPPALPAVAPAFNSVPSPPPGLPHPPSATRSTFTPPGDAGITAPSAQRVENSQPPPAPAPPASPAPAQRVADARTRPAPAQRVEPVRTRARTRRLEAYANASWEAATTASTPTAPLDPQQELHTIIAPTTRTVPLPPRTAAAPAQPGIPPAASALPELYVPSLFEPDSGTDPLSMHFAHCARRAEAAAQANLASGSQSTTVDISRLNLNDDGSPLTYRTATRGKDKDKWETAQVEELMRLSHLGSKTLFPVHRRDIPIDRRGDVTYYNPKPKEKLDSAGNLIRRIRGTAGGDLINYPGDVSAPVADLDPVKIVIQSVISDDAEWATMDVVAFYLGTRLERYEYAEMGKKHLPQIVIDQLGLQPYLDASKNNSVVFEIRKTLWGLPQAGILSRQKLVTGLAKHGDYHETGVASVFRHRTRPITFTLIVDDIGMKYQKGRKEDVLHLKATIEKIGYEVKLDWAGKNYIGYQIDFDHEARTVSLSYPGYVAKMINRFRPNGVTPRASPMVYTPPTYGSTAPQVTDAPDDSLPASPAQVLELQAIVGCALYYARAVDATALTATCALSSAQARPTAKVLAAADHLLGYLAAHPDHQLVFTACDMILHIHSDGSHLSRPNSTSVAGGLHFLGNKNDPLGINGAIHPLSQHIPCVTASAAETEYASLFMNGQVGSYLRYVLEEIGYPQPATQIVCDNTTAVGIAHDRVKARRAKFMDMRFHWIRDRVRQGQFTILWRPGAQNLADFFTKALPIKVHCAAMPLLVRLPVANRFAIAR
jgi:hypothetical protein